ncbi:hypothetical protein SNOG_09520 [Parastagonospora nodorum SN15]|uniref:Uncharacterized protein n=1 Tax=Phaeosphaeria nodorum (strain SN15 / ATCC MYA-4574 / FGSC 10173) TaxID=321614 RepID=Q0UFE4_PHANO|nr:hypothetical protein SNOG_09520 [Parastagonospora nodorum SN15]EAT82785.1 hypothetical protein SNOG_09520 [Parastagonospora nodorum SN15]
MYYGYKFMYEAVEQSPATGTQTQRRRGRGTLARAAHFFARHTDTACDRATCREVWIAHQRRDRQNGANDGDRAAARGCTPAPP